MQLARQNTKTIKHLTQVLLGCLFALNALEFWHSTVHRHFYCPDHEAVEEVTASVLPGNHGVAANYPTIQEVQQALAQHQTCLAVCQNQRSALKTNPLPPAVLAERLALKTPLPKLQAPRQPSLHWAPKTSPPHAA